ncbi:sensor histidine kinase [Bdellovibrio sp. HCB209]|uniref:sensor histidine kinase n=1 Tax=Bdellovibrio sp. HCB209 TaxID=3394354 RepID=UPI0039B3DF25
MSSSFIKSFWPDSSSLLQGIVRFRWIAIVFMMLGAFPLLRGGYLLREQLFYFMAVIALLAVFNGLTQGIWNKTTSAQEQSMLLVHLLVDLLAAAGLLFVSGSAANPFIFILALHGFLGGMLLRGFRSLAFIGVLIVLLSILQIETNKDASITLNIDRGELYFQFLSQWILVLAAWFVAYLFSGLLEKQEERIRSLQNRQHRADRLKSLGALAAGFSHEMATPLNSLKLRLDRGLRKIEDPTAARSEINQAQISLDECIAIFQKMAGVFTTSTDGELQKLNVNSVLKDIVRAWEADNKVTLRKEITEREFFCPIQPLSFAQTILDLLDNAKEASSAEAIITLRMYDETEEVVIEVIDAGSGVVPEVFERMGEPFNTNKQQGNGLGVYSALMTAQSMGGEFTLSNNSSGKGATARLTIPHEGLE